MPLKPTESVLVSDFDGTMTRHDFYQLVRARWWDESDPDPWQDFLAGHLTHFEALNRFFARIRCSEPELVKLALGMELAPGLTAALERLHEGGWRLVIASAGCEWYINHLLAGARIPFTLHANPGRLTAKGSLEMSLPVGSPFFSPLTGIDKTAVVRDALGRYDRVAFAGDGPPDLAAARLIPSHLRFARGYLAEKLRAGGEAFQPLVNWEMLATGLLDRSPA
jgi:2-hydroxy-3-keto-5-methylthiopentenyl-1-phosphate phosphatase